ncbi:hypothetical protein [Pacificoceanicola onchidii]|uniref:hypothetical protein n=1 Tax=Pacificoceanicola onchidii TaxID=2562685 RepID=UPI0010A55357|nr:hypothetical protein [Pacificoceanicola onchidii]
MRKLSANTALGLGCIAVALVVAFVWIPLDTDTWLVERKRGKYIIGDSLAPTLAMGFVLVAGLLLLLEKGESDEYPRRDNLIFIGAMAGIGIVSLLLMRWAGPGIAALFASEEYRLLRDTAPWKYIGFVLGGVTMIFTMITFVEERPSWRALWIALVAVAGIILLYDVPFDDILLPPNGDV